MNPRLFLMFVTACAFGADTWRDTAGNPRSLPAGPTVLFFVMTDCPLSNGYVPEMNRIHADFGKRGISVLGVFAEDVKPADAKRHTEEFQYQFPVLLDPGNRLARKVGAKTVPEVAVLKGGRVAYLGRIDNRMEDFGKHRSVITQTDLRDALTAVVAGKSPAVARTKALGCAISLEMK